MKQRATKRRSIKSQILTTAFTLTFLAITVPTFITSQLFIKNFEQENTRSSIEIFQQVEERIYFLLQNAQNQANTVLNSPQVLDYLVKNYDNQDEELTAKYEFVQEVSQHINFSSDITSIMFFHENGKMAGTSLVMRYFWPDNTAPVLETLKSLPFRSGTEWLGLVRSEDLLPPGELIVSKENEYKICGATKQIFRFTSKPHYDCIYTLFEINPSLLLDCFSHLEYENSQVCLLNQSGIVLSGSLPIGSVPEFFTEIGTDDSNSFLFKDSNKKSSQIIYHKMKNIGWTLVKIIPQEVYMSKIISMWTVALICGIVILLLLLVLYSLWAKKFCIPIVRLTSTIHELKETNLDCRVELEDHYSNELYQVCEQFNEMLDNINTLLLQKELHERERADLEIRTLQSQISPHFIYNTLTSIRYMAFFLQATKVEEALITFSNIIRPIFSTWQADWSLKEELEFIKNYISLIRLRFENLIDIEIITDESANICRIPRFTLQTLLENSVEHGFQGNTPLHIILKTEILDGILFIYVKDNGIGIAPDKLAHINERIKKNVDFVRIEGESIGLANLDRRLKLFAGLDCGLSIVSTPHEGTDIILRIRVITD